MARASLFCTVAGGVTDNGGITKAMWNTADPSTAAIQLIVPRQFCGGSMGEKSAVTERPRYITVPAVVSRTVFFVCPPGRSLIYPLGVCRSRDKVNNARIGDFTIYCSITGDYSK